MRRLAFRSDINPFKINSLEDIFIFKPLYNVLFPLTVLVCKIIFQEFLKNNKKGYGLYIKMCVGKNIK